MLLKVCGLREKENVLALAGLKPHWIGFIFVPASPRYFYGAKEPVEISSIPKEVYKAGVFVNEDMAKVISIYNKYELDYVQLHGNESADYCKGLFAEGKKIIKAFGIYNEFDFSIVESYEPYVSLFLFDTAGKLYGGNGVQFNHDLLIDKKFSKPFLLSGGIGPDDAEALKKFNHPDLLGVDINSKFETAPGLKNVEAIQLFKQQIA